MEVYQCLVYLALTLSFRPDFASSEINWWSTGIEQTNLHVSCLIVGRLFCVERFVGALEVKYLGVRPDPLDLFCRETIILVGFIEG